MTLKEKSKFLSYVLRHKPDAIGVVLDAQGWVPVATLLERVAASGQPMTETELIEIVATSDKKRFTLSPDGRTIRAAQGHSVQVNLALPPGLPPARLFHGTSEASLEAILCEGLKPGRRLQVHLSSDRETAIKVGQRHGKPVVLTVDTERMRQAGLVFYQAENGTWLTDQVPSEFLTKP